MRAPRRVRGGDPVMLGVGAALAAALAWSAFADVKNKVEKRHLQVAVDLPDLTNQIIILSCLLYTSRCV